MTMEKKAVKTMTEYLHKASEFYIVCQGIFCYAVLGVKFGVKERRKLYAEGRNTERRKEGKPLEAAASEQVPVCDAAAADGIFSAIQI